MYDDQGVQKKDLKIDNGPAMFCITSSGVNDTDISFISRKNLEMSSSMRGTFSRSSSRLTRHCISDPFDKQASNKERTENRQWPN
jgi:hypothetical protein